MRNLGPSSAFKSTARPDLGSSMSRSSTDESIRGEKLFWEGPLFGRLTKVGKEYLLDHGWTRVDGEDSVPDYSKTNQKLAFIWPNKTGPQFELSDIQAAWIRPYPKHITDVVDDKLRLAQCVEGLGISPTSIASPDDAEPDKLYFVKHRYGAQGKSVYVYNQQELEGWWRKARNPQDFVIQEEIPPVLHDGRKFVLRSHILIVQKEGYPMVAYIHEYVICQHHSLRYDATGRLKASHISQGGKQFPRPQPLGELESTHPAYGCFNRIAACSNELLQAVAGEFDVGNKISPGCTVFALLGSDLLIDDTGNIQLCEVNSHPALGWGTMAKVETAIFSELIQDALSIILHKDRGGIVPSASRLHKLTADSVSG